MRFTLCLAVVLTSAIGALPGSAFNSPAAIQPADTIVPCNVSAFVIDQDPKGLNVRSGPGKNSAVIGNLPNKPDTGVLVHITGSSGNWLRIDSAHEEGTDEEQQLFNGAGWIYGPLLGLTGIADPKGGTPLYNQPSRKGQIIKRVTGGDDVKVWSCRGEWFYVDYKNVKGWAAAKTLCSNSLTTCV